MAKAGCCEVHYLDTDTALDNARAQRYCKKNDFTREGIPRSYHLVK